MNIQNNNEAQSPELAKPDHKFHWGFATGGFILGLVSDVMIVAVIIAIVFGLSTFTFGSADVAFMVGFFAVAALAVLTPLVLAYWFGNISWSGDQALRRNESRVVESSPRYWHGIRGRVNRLGFLAVAVVLIFVLFLLGFAIEFLEARSPGSSRTIMWPAIVVELGIAGLGISLIVRRLHDLGFSGFFAAISLIPLGGQVFLITLLVLPGNNRPNKYGPQP